MTPAQADALLDAIIECRQTSRRMMAYEQEDHAAAMDADDAAFKTVTDLIKEATT